MNNFENENSQHNLYSSTTQSVPTYIHTDMFLVFLKNGIIYNMIIYHNLLFVNAAIICLVVFNDLFNYSFVVMLILLRLNPKNDHQRPTVVLLCGPHLQGAQGVSCARHLANHDVEVALFLPSFLKMQPPVSSELDLYSKTSGRQVDSVKGRKHLWSRNTQDKVWIINTTCCVSTQKINVAL